jgi:hypothetical protein
MYEANAPALLIAFSFIKPEFYIFTGDDQGMYAVISKIIISLILPNQEFFFNSN